MMHSFSLSYIDAVEESVSATVRIVACKKSHVTHGVLKESTYYKETTRLVRIGSESC
jgi:hypothetical protein